MMRQQRWFPIGSGVRGPVVGFVAVALIAGGCSSHRSDAASPNSSSRLGGGPAASSPNVAIPSAPSSAASSPVPSSAASSAAASLSSSPLAPPKSLPVSVQSDAAMKAAGNAGPTSSILAPTSCVISGATVTAAGSYAGGLAPEVYPRYGDVVKLYVDTAPATGYPQGIQVALLSSENSPAIGGKGTWRVSAPIDLTGGQPVACMVAAQPTHDFEGAPARY